MILGVGVDLVDVPRFERTLARTPRLADRLFCESEQKLPSGEPRSTRSLAARFAAKEALAKALRQPGQVTARDVRVVQGGDGAPSIELSGSTLELAQSLGVARWHLSLSHDGGFALAYVIAEGAE